MVELKDSTRQLSPKALCSRKRARHELSCNSADICLQDTCSSREESTSTYFSLHRSFWALQHSIIRWRRRKTLQELHIHKFREQGCYISYLPWSRTRKRDWKRDSAISMANMKEEYVIRQRELRSDSNYSSTNHGRRHPPHSTCPPSRIASRNPSRLELSA